MSNLSLREAAQQALAEWDHEDGRHNILVDRMNDLRAALAQPDKEYEAMLAVMEQVDPATIPGLTVAQRAALGRFAKPVNATDDKAQPVAVVQKMMCRLAELLDEDQFAEMERIANSAGVYPPQPATQPPAEQPLSVRYRAELVEKDMKPVREAFPGEQGAGLSDEQIDTIVRESRRAVGEANRRLCRAAIAADRKARGGAA